MSTAIINTTQVWDANNNLLSSLLTNLLSANSIQLANGASSVATTTYPILQQWFTANTIASQTFPIIYCTDVGLCQWTGTAWAPLHPFTILSTGVPVGLAPNGTVGANGALTLGTALDQTYSNGCYMRFPGGALYAGSPSNAYYVVMANTTHGTVYNNQYNFGNPQIPESPTPIVATSVGAYSQAAGSVGNNIDLLNGILPANCIGLNGEIRTSYVWTCSSSANNKSLQVQLGGTGFTPLTSDTQTTATIRAGTSYTRFSGNANSQVCFTSSNGDSGTGTSISYTSYPTNVNQAFSIKAILSSNLDWIMLQSATVQVTSSILNDSPAPYQVLPASNTIIPIPAAAVGYNNCAFFLRPTLSDLSLSNTTNTAFYATNANVTYSMTSSPFTPSGNVFTIAGGLGGNEYGQIQTQRLNAQSVAAGQAALSYLLPNTGFYAEWQFWLSDNFSDHWAACWMLPMEHNPIQSDNPPGTPVGYEAYAELDVIETGIVGSIYGTQFHGALQSLVNWYGYYSKALTLTGSPSTGATTGTLSSTWGGPTSNQQCKTSTGQTLTISCNNSNSAVTWSPSITGSPNATLTFGYTNQTYNNNQGAPFDWTVPHTVGVLPNPANNTISFYFDGILQQQYDYSAYSTIGPYHYYMILNAASAGLYVPYNMYVGYIQAWTP